MLCQAWQPQKIKKIIQLSQYLGQVSSKPKSKSSVKLKFSHMSMFQAGLSNK